MHATTRLRAYRAHVDLRAGTPADAPVCGRIIYDAFATIASAHGFPADLPSVESARGLASRLLAMTLMSRGFYNEPAGAFLPSVIF